MQYPMYSRLSGHYPTHDQAYPITDTRMYGWNLGQLTPLLGMGSSLAHSMGYGNLGKMLGTANQFMGNLPSMLPQGWGTSMNTPNPLNPLTWGNMSPTVPQAGWGNSSGFGWLSPLFNGTIPSTGYNGGPLQNTGTPPFGTQPFFPQGPAPTQGNWPGYGYGFF
ncbi:hypothetical protein JOD43_001455 [Pullulanibacillus pueri]|uniref:Uncharacterized protein n=1 Tax=Pullulanibacillus pueri TaxID=1437324 RepID=A0A8J2ZUN7_9BACL|nr:hypothetical protein [Pullulanibacillus pueri]MBM7681288.1 hypothetical protein [Pullulanibacillus pueri]GGH77731.1 hypothetical protein GCM10007096_10060 [Pullulanibacillus pueri]